MDDPRPAKRHRADSNEWFFMRRHFSKSPCRVCGSGWDSLHHLYPRGQGGDDAIENLIPLCGSGTTGCHGLVENHNRAARATVRATLTDANRWYLTYKLGHRAAGWLDSQYPEFAA